VEDRWRTIDPLGPIGRPSSAESAHKKASQDWEALWGRISH
jgi:hypothetical protein